MTFAYKVTTIFVKPTIRKKPRSADPRYHVLDHNLSHKVPVFNGSEHDILHQDHNYLPFKDVLFSKEMITINVSRSIELIKSLSTVYFSRHETFGQHVGTILATLSIFTVYSRSLMNVRELQEFSKMARALQNPKKGITLLQTAEQKFVKATCGLIQKLLRAAARENLRRHDLYPDLPLVPASRLVQNKVVF
ncbi:hypothetical protein AB4K20DRAFT_1989480 [Rhizopus microsporus]|uniref:Uncharacterized protein n=1 Tax=Rhizopus microsporus TaxID=58291 RepID=A0A1X0S5K9_RHIZD|nr:hypothetical protein BCV71DRAFT_233880 [Rhizopus microsporus]